MYNSELYSSHVFASARKDLVGDLGEDVVIEVVDFLIEQNPVLLYKTKSEIAPSEWKDIISYGKQFKDDLCGWMSPYDILSDLEERPW